MTRLWVVCWWVDVRTLYAAQCVLVWLVEWLSVSQRKLERVVIFSYLITEPVYLRMKPASSMWFVVLVEIIWGALLFGWHRHTDKERWQRLLAADGSGLRVFYLACWLLLLASLYPARHEAWVFVEAFASGLRLAALYFTSLPESGQPGRRRRLALDKVKAMFGTSWMPQPVPEWEGA